MYINYGCGLDAPKEWQNYDASPGIRIQKNPFLYLLLKRYLNVKFPSNVKYGDIIKGLKGVKENSCDGIYCSHVLEHLSLNDFRIALKNSYAYLKPGGIFRCIVPDLAYHAKQYIHRLEEKDIAASHKFLQITDLGQTTRPKTIKQYLNAYLTNSRHLWMWDELSLKEELKKTGFQKIRSCQFNDSRDAMYKRVERESRFKNSVALEAIK